MSLAFDAARATRPHGAGKALRTGRILIFVTRGTLMPGEYGHDWFEMGQTRRRCL